jgi:hypothetical protein
VHQVAVEQIIVVRVELGHQRVAHKFEAIRSLGGVLYQATVVHEVEEFLRELAAHRVFDPGSCLILGGKHDPVESHPLVRIDSNCQLIGNNTQAPNIGQLIVGLSHQDLWSHPLGGTFDLLLVIFFGNQLSCQTKITELDFSICGEHHIQWL